MTRIDVSESLPPPAMLGDYNVAVQDGAERIMRMAESQHAHRLALETKVISSDIVRSYIGLVAGTLIIIVAIIVGAVLVIQGKDVQGLLFGIGALCAGLGSFIWGYHKRTNQIETLRRGS